MELASIKKKTAEFIKKYKYVVLILLIGLVLMALPTRTDTQSEIQTQNNEKNENAEKIQLDHQLEILLSKVDGAGDVSVILTIEAGEETVFQTDTNHALSDTGNTTDITTIVITDAQRNQNGLIKQVKQPIYKGAIIVCEGADSPTVRLAIVDAVSKATGLGTDRISVLKMK